MRFTRTATVALTAASLVLVAGCSSDIDDSPTSTPVEEAAQPEQVVPSETPEPVDLTGEWKQTNSKSEDSYQASTITADTIEVYWIGDGGDTKSLYWAGTADIPADAGDSFSWESANDASKTELALLASEDATKTFTYEDGEISYEVTAMGTTIVARLGRE